MGSIWSFEKYKKFRVPYSNNLRNMCRLSEGIQIDYRQSYLYGAPIYKSINDIWTNLPRFLRIRTAIVILTCGASYFLLFPANFYYKQRRYRCYASESFSTSSIQSEYFRVFLNFVNPVWIPPPYHWPAREPLAKTNYLRLLQDSNLRENFPVDF